MAHDLILSRAKLGTFMLATHPDIYAAQRHMHWLIAGNVAWLQPKGRGQTDKGQIVTFLMCAMISMFAVAILSNSSMSWIFALAGILIVSNNT